MNSRKYCSHSQPLTEPKNVLLLCVQCSTLFYQRTLIILAKLMEKPVHMLTFLVGEFSPDRQTVFEFM